MLKWLLFAIIVIPTIEIWGIVQIGHQIGIIPTIGLILFTGFAGAYLARLEGRKALMEVQRQMNNGQPPGHAVLNGICVLIGGILLLTPGFFTDIVGLTLLLPLTRPFYRKLLYKFIMEQMKHGKFMVMR
jgi:UPF0716 protein FxsA